MCPVSGAAKLLRSEGFGDHASFPHYYGRLCARRTRQIESQGEVDSLWRRRSSAPRFFRIALSLLAFLIVAMLSRCRAKQAHWLLGSEILPAFFLWPCSARPVTILRALVRHCMRDSGISPFQRNFRPWACGCKCMQE
eukprot:scaffold442_cov268-Pinguiococcus_pyrenoidosus.AAC.41